MIKFVVILGGIHGSGKTTIARELSSRIDARVIRQHREIYSIANVNENTTWAEIGPKYTQYLEKAANRVSAEFLNSSHRLLIVDSHYAICTKRSYRCFPLRNTLEYVADLEYDFLKPMLQQCLFLLVFLDISPLIAVKRIKVADRKIEPEIHQVKELYLLAKWERFFMVELGLKIAKSKLLYLGTDHKSTKDLADSIISELNTW